MSAWYEEEPSQAFRKSVEHRAFQLIDNMADDVVRDHTEGVSRRTSWFSLFRIATGLSVATLVGILITRRNSDKAMQTDTATLPLQAALTDLALDSLAIDLLEQAPLDFDFLADLELLENFDELSEISEDDLTKENV